MSNISRDEDRNRYLDDPDLQRLEKEREYWAAKKMRRISTTAEQDISVHLPHTIPMISNVQPQSPSSKKHKKKKKEKKKKRHK